MAQSQEHIAKLAKQFPLVGRLLKEREEGKARKAVVSVDVQKIGTDFLFTIPRSYLGSSGYVGCIGKNLKGAFQSKVYAVLEGADDPVVWDQFDECPQRFVYELLCDTLGTPTLMKRIQYVVLSSVTNWFKMPTRGERSDGLHFVDWVKCEVEMHVYIPPAEGVASVLETADPCHNVKLDDVMLMHGVTMRDGIADGLKKRFCAASNLLHGSAKSFEHIVYLNGLRDLMIKSEGKKVYCQVGHTSIESFCNDDRVQILLSNGDSNLCLNASDEDPERPKMHIGSQVGTLADLLGMVSEVSRAWSTTHPSERAERFKIIIDDPAE